MEMANIPKSAPLLSHQLVLPIFEWPYFFQPIKLDDFKLVLFICLPCVSGTWSFTTNSWYREIVEAMVDAAPLC
jgi:hypothetical protein